MSLYIFANRTWLYSAFCIPNTINFIISSLSNHSKMQFCICLGHLGFYPWFYLLPSFTKVLTQLPRVKLGKTVLRFYPPTLLVTEPQIYAAINSWRLLISMLASSQQSADGLHCTDHVQQRDQTVWAAIQEGWQAGPISDTSAQMARGGKWGAIRLLHCNLLQVQTTASVNLAMPTSVPDIDPTPWISHSVESNRIETKTLN